MTSAHTTIEPNVKTRAAFMNLVEALGLERAEYHISGGQPNPHNGKNTVSNGPWKLINHLKMMALYRRLEEDGGYIREVRWRPNFHLKLIANDGIEFTNGTRFHTVGLTKTKFEPQSDQFVFSTEAELVASILAKATEWFELAGVKTHLGE